MGDATAGDAPEPNAGFVARCNKIDTKGLTQAGPALRRGSGAVAGIEALGR
ncbi:hypothetical protein PI125_g22654 [Phytophthora idaei]|nr:hypothetical protein PI125_g22654 [Phytophthora idaei]